MFDFLIDIVSRDGVEDGMEEVVRESEGIEVEVEAEVDGDGDGNGNGGWEWWVGAIPRGTVVI